MKKKLSVIILFLFVMIIPFKVFGEEPDDIMTIQIQQTEGEKSSNAYLSDITLSYGELDFHKDKKNYTVGIPFTVDSLTVTATPEDEKATVSVTGSNTLQFGKNTFTITVTAEDGSKSIYKVIAYKLHEGETIDNTYLSSLFVLGHNINFNKEKREYTIQVKDNKPLQFNITLEDPNATYKIVNNEKLIDGGKVSIVVTARDGETIGRYDIITELNDGINYTLLIGLITVGAILAMTLVLLLYFQYRKRKLKKLLNNAKKNKTNNQLAIDININTSDSNNEVVVNSDTETSKKNNDDKTEIL